MTQLHVNPHLTEARYNPELVAVAASTISLMGYIVFVVWCEKSVLPVFATGRLLAVHILSALPIGYLVASRSRTFLQQRSFIHIVLLLLFVTLFFMLAPLSETLKLLGANYPVRWSIRSCFSIYFATMLLGPATAVGRQCFVKNGFGTLLVWLVLPYVYGLKQSEKAFDEFATSSSSMRLVASWQSLNRLVEISGHSMVLGQSTVLWDRNLRRQIHDTELFAAKPLSGKATTHDKLQLAMLLLSLSRNSEAITLLGDLDASDSQVQLLGAIAWRELEDWANVESRCRRIIATQLENPVAKDILPYQLLGESLIRQRKVKDAMKCFREAIVVCPHAVGDFEMRIGSLLGESGDHAGAITHFELARQAEPALASESTRRISAMRNNSCLLSPR